jgi:hypothetical protein
VTDPGGGTLPPPPPGRSPHKHGRDRSTRALPSRALLSPAPPLPPPPPPHRLRPADYGFPRRASDQSVGRRAHKILARVGQAPDIQKSGFRRILHVCAGALTCHLRRIFESRPLRPYALKPGRLSEDTQGSKPRLPFQNYSSSFQTTSSRSWREVKGAGSLIEILRSLRPFFVEILESLEKRASDF